MVAKSLTSHFLLALILLKILIVQMRQDNSALGTCRDCGAGVAGRATALPLFCWDLLSGAPVDRLQTEPMLPRKRCSSARLEVGTGAPGYPQTTKHL